MNKDLSDILFVAFREVGQSEINGSDDNPRIREYHAAVDGQELADEIPWCSSFVNWCLESCGFKGTGSRLARSFENWGASIDTPLPGCIAVFKRGSKSWQGHVAIYLYETPKSIVVIGGNQSNSVNVQAYSREKLIGYRTIA